MVAGWAGGLLVVAGLAAGLVAWVGWDRANAYLGIPAAAAALIGLGVSVYALTAGPSGGGSQSGRRVRQRASATGKARLVQVGGSATGSAGSQPAAGPSEWVDQHASALGDARVDQVAGDRDAAQG